MKTANKAITFFKAGAWLLTVAGFGHAIVSVFDVWFRGAFSPLDDKAILALKETTIGIADFMKGAGTSVFHSAWGAYLGFTIAVGLLTGFIGLVFGVISRGESPIDSRYKTIALVAVIVSGMMTVIGVFFYFYFPTTILAVSFICFTIGWFRLNKGVIYAAGQIHT
jgi:hypothetical protein